VNRRVVWHAQALDDLARIGRQDRRMVQRISHAVDQLAEHNVGDVVKLTDQAGLYRLRVGDWRVIFTFEERGQVLLVQRVLNRRDAYR
jgi:mRNA interferase RelE/StbE